MVRMVGEKALLPIQKYVDEVVLVDEEEITKSILFLLEREKILAEVAGAAGVAAVLHGRIVTARRTVPALVSVGNIEVTLVARMVEPKPSQGWRAVAPERDFSPTAREASTKRQV